MIFFLTIALTAYTSAMIKLQVQNQDLERIKASYEQDISDEALEALYNKLVGKVTEDKPKPIIKAWNSSSNTDFHESSIRNSITEIEFVDLKTKTRPASINGTTSWDVSEAQDKSVIAWLDGTKLYIGGENGVKANADSSYVFYNFANVKNINFNGNYDTSEATTMAWMFANSSKIKKLDLIDFNTSKVKNMAEMFAGVTADWKTRNQMSLTSINLSSFDTSSVYYMNNMFYFCTNISTLDLRNFDTKNVTLMNGLFSRCWGLKNVDLSSFDTSKVQTMEAMFSSWYNNEYGSPMALKTIYVGDKWSTASVTNSNGIFTNCTNLVGGNGTQFSSDSITYARIDKPGQLGYLTGVD